MKNDYLKNDDCLGLKIKYSETSQVKTQINKVFILFLALPEYVILVHILFEEF